MHDFVSIDDLVTRALATLGRAQLAHPGEYKRFAAVGDVRDASLNPYGVADAANLLYTLGHFPEHGSPQRDGFVQTLRDMQDPATGLWHEATHHDYHCTAHCLAALELFDAGSSHALTAIEPFATPNGIRGLLESINWVYTPWSGSHRGAGVFAALMLSDRADDATRDAYFDWLAENADPATGLFRRGALPGQAEGSRPLHEHMGSSFHYLFNTEAARRPIAHAAALVDTCLALFESGQVERDFARSIAFVYVDWVYCLSRGVRHSGHRHADARHALASSAAVLVDYVRSLDAETDPGVNDLHTLFGTWCAFAELQTAVPGLIRTRRPLKNVLDRRPFI